jgi:7-carboxy-7-deazaguanine synthase
MIPIVETFVSIQGEGPSAGEPALFLRLANCNLSCVWCDTRHSWDWAAFDKDDEVSILSPDALRGRLARELPAEVRLLVLTGGEPLLHQGVVAGVIVSLQTERPDLRVEVETNGTIVPTPAFRDLVHLFVVSPKLANSGVPEKRRLRLSVLGAFSELSAVLKFVLEGPDEVQEAVDVAERSGFARSRVWVMPQATSAAELGPRIAELAPAVIGAGLRVSSRLQVLAWGDVRGT